MEKVRFQIVKDMLNYENDKNTHILTKNDIKMKNIRGKRLQQNRTRLREIGDSPWCRILRIKGGSEYEIITKKQTVGSLALYDHTDDFFCFR